METRRCYRRCKAAILSSWCATNPFPSVPDVENIPPTSTQLLASRGGRIEGAATAHSEALYVMMTGSTVSLAVAVALTKEAAAFPARARDGVLLPTGGDRNAAFPLV